jgi:hypothetical protein
MTPGGYSRNLLQFRLRDRQSMHSSSRFRGGLGRGLARWWRSYVVNECPDERALRIRQERIARIKQDVELLEAMRVWEAWHETEKASSLSTPGREQAA